MAKEQLLVSKTILLILMLIIQGIHCQIPQGPELLVTFLPEPITEREDFITIQVSIVAIAQFGDPIDCDFILDFIILERSARKSCIRLINALPCHFIIIKLFILLLIIIVNGLNLIGHNG